MRPKSWHSRWYHHWLSLGGKRPAYKENLCRYVRILLIWAPLRWFFMGRVKRVSPWMVGFPLLTVAIVTGAANEWPGGTLNVLKWFGITIGLILGAVIAFVAFCFLCDYPKELKKAGKILTAPVWIAPYGIYRAGRPVWKCLGRWTDNAIGWFFGEIYPVGIVILAGVVFGLVYQAPTMLKALEILGFIVAAIVVVFLAIFVFVEDGLNFGSPFKRMGAGLLDTLKLTVTYLNTKKRGSRICPFIEFDEVQTG